MNHVKTVIEIMLVVSLTIYWLAGSIAGTLDNPIIVGLLILIFVSILWKGKDNG